MTQVAEKVQPWVGALDGRPQGGPPWLQGLRDRGAVAFVPHAGPLTELAEPEYALVEGHAIAHAVRRA